ncbi:MAG: HAMP domain-containing histidine kinase [Lachnospiraceae bacterium]|nr:HAMP domain-containing histidine kinase [Lachnospiraceae bacterium]
MKKLSIRAKITLWFSAILVVNVTLTFFVILSVSRQTIQKTIRDTLISAVEDNVDEIEYYSSLDSVLTGQDIDYYVRYQDGYIEIDDDFLDEVNGIYTALYQSDGTLIYGENPIAAYTSSLSFLDSEVQRVTVNGTLYYVFDRQLASGGSGTSDGTEETDGSDSSDALDGLWLRGIVSEEQGDVEMSAISRTSLILLPGLVLLAVIGGWVIARRALAPIQDISDTAARIRQGDDLKERIELGDGKDELHRLAEQFNEMFTRLEDSFQEQQQFVSDASHELRTPVAVIRAQCDLVLDEEHCTPEEYREALETIARQSKKMNRMISDMLDVTRLKLQPERYAKEDLDLSELVTGVCQDMALIRENGITLTCSAEPELHLLGSRELLTRLLTNLISNAYRYGNPCGHIYVTLAADTRTENRLPAAGTGSHTEHIGKTARTICLTVQDDGIGISKEDLPNIFRRFYQADASRSGNGSGLGLAMVKEIAAFHNASVSVESSPGCGSTFTVEFF